MQMTFNSCVFSKLSLSPGSDGPTQKFHITALFTQVLAEKLRCHDACFCDSGVPRQFDKHAPGRKIDGVKITFEIGTFVGDLSGVVIQPAEGEHAAHLEINFVLSLPGDVPLYLWALDINTSEFSIIVEPPEDYDAQGDLFEQPLATSDADTGCIECNNSIPIMDGDPSMHASGQKCAAYSGGKDDGPALAPAALMGGSHQRKGKKGSGVIAEIKTTQVQ